MRYHLTPVRMAIIKKTKKKRQQITSIGEDVEKMTTCALLVGIQIGAATMENYRGSSKIKIELPHNPAILCIHPK